MRDLEKWIGSGSPTHIGISTPCPFFGLVVWVALGRNGSWAACKTWFKHQELLTPEIATCN
jgi:hypothetical protein